MSSWSNWFGALTSTAAATMDNLVNSLDIHNNTSTSTGTTNTGIPSEEERRIQDQVPPKQVSTIRERGGCDCQDRGQDL